MARMLGLENQHGDDLPNKAEVVNIGSQDMFLEEIPMNELAH